jgi:hypothetical protein
VDASERPRLEPWTYQNVDSAQAACVFTHSLAPLSARCSQPIATALAPLGLALQPRQEEGKLDSVPDARF